MACLSLKISILITFFFYVKFKKKKNNWKIRYLTGNFHRKLNWHDWNLFFFKYLYSDCCNCRTINNLDAHNWFYSSCFKKKITTANGLLDSISENILHVSNIGQPKRQQRLLFVMQTAHISHRHCVYLRCCRYLVNSHVSSEYLLGKKKKSEFNPIWKFRFHAIRLNNANNIRNRPKSNCFIISRGEYLGYIIVTLYVPFLSAWYFPSHVEQKKRMETIRRII